MLHNQKVALCIYNKKEQEEATDSLPDVQEPLKVDNCIASLSPPSTRSNPKGYQGCSNRQGNIPVVALIHQGLPQRMPRHQTTTQAPLYVLPQQSLADSMASLNISTQGAYAAAALPQGSYPIPAPAQASVSYSPTDPSYEPYFSGAPTVPQNHLHQQSAPSQSPSYGSAGFPDVPPFPQAGYDPLPSSVMGSYSSNSSTTYEPPPPLIGSYDTSNQHVPASKPGYGSQVPGVGTGYSSSSSGAGVYGGSQQGMQGYDYPSSGQLGPYDQGGGMYGTPAQGREYDRPAYSPAPAYDTTYYDKPAAYDRVPAKNAYDFDDVGLGEVYAYDGGNVEPYGARGTGTGGSWAGLDNYGSGFSPYGSSGTSKLPKAVPKVETEDKNSGVQKYRVKMLSDASSSTPQNVLCQIGLDGVRMISPTTNKTVRIYPLETITRWEVNEPSVFTFWAKSAVDPEARRIRLQSGSYTTNAILDTLTAACVQFSEMVGKVDSSKAATDADKSTDQNADKKKPAFVNWASLRNRQLAPEEKQHWVPDEAVTKCSACSSDFGPFLRRHHCRNCGDVFCDKCTHGRIALTSEEDAPVVRVCDRCLAEVTHRLTNAKETSGRAVTAPRTHEDLAKKLQEELERNSSKKPTTTSSGTGAPRGAPPVGWTHLVLEGIAPEEARGLAQMVQASACGRWHAPLVQFTFRSRCQVLVLKLLSVGFASIHSS
ncbi:hypothetical protein GOP47_0015516 [Adiantum capillus-veneris]|uniref:FYVE-type domain-containing protein n=1 Tax=Adiantum capillus-veneris TaxID=13818 RepID=A0A9D4UJX7_ADICA|nr:hypothetical protein GOP47_0015516 [Adiantum capillus-veneris]